MYGRCINVLRWRCVSSMDQADITFNNNVRTSEETVEGRTHTIFGDYWYTDDLLDEYLSVSTSIHRMNARLAMATQLLTAAFDANPDHTIHDLYNDLINLEGLYKVQDYEGAPGETISATTKSATLPSTTDCIHVLDATPPIRITTVVNPWVFSAHQPSWLDRTSPPTWMKSTKRFVAISKTR